MRARYLGSKMGWRLYDMGGYVRAWSDVWTDWGAVRYTGEPLEEAADRVIHEGRWVRDVTGHPWLVVDSCVEADPRAVETFLYGEARGMTHVILYDGKKWGYLPYPPEEDFEPDDVMPLEGEDPAKWRVPILDELRPDPSDIEDAKELYRYLAERKE